MKKLVFLLLMLFSTSYCSADMTGTVVDTETGEPIEGAIVLMEWTKEKGPPGLTSTESHKVIEIVTDKDGKFEIQKLRDPLVDFHVTVYKKGYVAWNNKFIFPDFRHRTDFTWGKGYTVKMGKFKKGYSYSNHVSFISTCMRSGRNLESKQKIYKAIDWERELAFKEEMKQKEGTK